MRQHRRVFVAADQDWFRSVSGDGNPIHVDPSWAACNFPGGTVVHGIHALCWGLEQCLKERGPHGVRGLQVTFVHPIMLGDEVSAEASDDTSSVRWVVRNEPVIVARLRLGPMPTQSVPRAAFSSSELSPRDATFDELKHLQGRVELPPGIVALAAAFPAVTASFGTSMLAGLAALSALVGMECPGLRGVFSGFTVDGAESTPDDHLAYRVIRADSVFSRLEMEVKGLGLSGSVSAFAGRDYLPPSDSEIRALVRPGEFAGSAPLVVGGSGGLGAVAARLLSAGGAVPTVTWHNSKAGADATQRSARALGGACEVIRLDVNRPADGLAALSAANWAGAHLYYFATPRIFRRRVDVYQPEDLRAFCDVYVDGFFSLVTAVMQRRAGARLTIFYPSTVAIAEESPDLIEYCMAKLAGERLCARLRERYRNLSITIARLPRVDTRQTAGFVRNPSEPPHKIMLPIVRTIQGISIG